MKMPQLLLRQLPAAPLKTRKLKLLVPPGLVIKGRRRAFRSDILDCYIYVELLPK